MKRKYLFIGLLVVVCGLIYWFGFHRSAPSNTLPTNANAVIVLDAKSIRNDFIWDYLQKPSDWFKTDSIKTIKWQDAIEIPDFLTIFHMKDESWNSWSMVLKISDSEKLKAKFDSIGLAPQNGSIKGMQKVESNGFKSYFSKEYIWIQFGNPSEDIEKIAFNYLKKPEKKRKNSFDVDLYDLEKDGKVICLKNSLLKDNLALNLDFLKSEWTIDGELPLNFSWQNENLSLQESSGLQLAFAFPKALNPNEYLKKRFYQFTQMQWDSLQKYEPQTLNFQLLPSDVKNDTIITYDYDDDFNEIEVKTVEERFAFRYYSQLDFHNAVGFKNYLTQSKLTEKEGDKIIFTPFPLEKTYMSLDGNYLNFFTSNTAFPKLKKSQDACAFLTLNFKQMDKGLKKEIISLIPKIENLINQSISMNGKIYSDKNSIYLKGKIKQNEDKFLFGIIFE